LNATVTLVLFQPAAFAAGEGVAVIVGGDLSRLMVTEAVAVFPALSVAVPTTTWLAPSVATVAGPEQDATPLVLSEQAKVTVTLELFHPAALAAGAATAMIVGGTLSTPMIWRLNDSPGWPRNSTDSWLLSSSVTGFVINVTLVLKSFGTATSTPFRVTTALETPVLPIRSV
jgi:hypothetical protein